MTNLMTNIKSSIMINIVTKIMTNTTRNVSYIMIDTTKKHQSHYKWPTILQEIL